MNNEASIGEGAPQVPQTPGVSPAPLYTPKPAVTTAADLTTGQKAGWLFVGFLMGVPGILVAWLTNVSAPASWRNTAIKFSAIGFAIDIVLVFVLFAMLGCSTAALLNSTYY